VGAHVVYVLSISYNMLTSRQSLRDQRWRFPCPIIWTPLDVKLISGRAALLCEERLRVECPIQLVWRCISTLGVHSEWCWQKTAPPVDYIQKIYNTTRPDSCKVAFTTVFICNYWNAHVQTVVFPGHHPLLCNGYNSFCNTFVCYYWNTRHCVTDIPSVVTHLLFICYFWNAHVQDSCHFRTHSLLWTDMSKFVLWHICCLFVVIGTHTSKDSCHFRTHSLLCSRYI
jgi:hypothetical protein